MFCALIVRNLRSTNDAWLDDDNDDPGTKSPTPPQSGAAVEVDTRSRRGFEVRPSPDVSDRSGSRGNNGKRARGSNVLTVLMRLYGAVLRRCDDDDGSSPPGQHLLLGPVAHLIGLVCATGVPVRDLRLLLVAAEGGLPSSLPPSSEGGTRGRAGGGLAALARLHVVRCLRYAAEYSVRGNAELDRPGPRVSSVFEKVFRQRTSCRFPSFVVFCSLAQHHLLSNTFFFYAL